MPNKIVRPFFHEYQQGFTKGLTLFNKPVFQNQQPPMSEEECQWLKDIVASASKKRPDQLILSGDNMNNKMHIANHLSQELGQTLCLIDCDALLSNQFERTVSRVVAEAENKHWILFFDEADAFFGTPSEVQDNHGRYANLEVSYLLKRITHYQGICLFSFKSMDSADKIKNRIRKWIRCS